MSTQKLPCGGTAYTDSDSNIGANICMDCLSVVGSIGMPKKCKELLDREKDEEDAIRARHGDPY